MLEGTDSYFHQPTYILHGLRFPLVVTSKAEQKGSVGEKKWIFKKIGGKVKNFSDPLVHQTVWFCLSFHGILSILLLLTRPYRKDQYLRCQDFLSPNPEEKNYVAMNYDHEKTPKRTQFTHVGTGRIPLLRGIAGVHLVLLFRRKCTSAYHQKCCCPGLHNIIAEVALFESDKFGAQGKWMEI